MLNLISHILSISFALHALTVTGLTLRVIMRRPPTGVAMAWLLAILALPYVGALAYLLIGERRIGRERARNLQALRGEFKEQASALLQLGTGEVDWSRHRPQFASISRLGDTLAGSPMVSGSHLELFGDTEAILSQLANDIDAATTSVTMEFYIWNAGGRADDVLEALIRATKRGVHCRVLIDALGARPWWRGDQPQRLREAGVALRPALPVGLWRTFIGRADLRLHRKIVLIDGRIAWTGSMNLVDPRFFKQDSGVGQWVDAMARIEGVAVAPLAVTLLGDWALESHEPVSQLITSSRLPKLASTGSADVQVIPAGPGQNGDALLQMIVACIHAANHELVLTTPYLIPDESLLQAIRGAAARGVRVDVVLPEKVDSFLTRHACRSYYDELLAAGVHIQLYRGGLLHTKSIRVDQNLSMFGTVNLDLRSFWLNYEVALFIHDASFASKLTDLHHAYLADCTELSRDGWARRSFTHRLIQDTLRLASPLL